MEWAWGLCKDQKNSRVYGRRGCWRGFWLRNLLPALLWCWGPNPGPYAN
jgi:hypothetical protein